MHFHFYMKYAGIYTKYVIDEISRNKSQLFARIIVIHQFRVNAEGGAPLVFGLLDAIATHSIFFVVSFINLLKGALPVIERNAGNTEVYAAGLLQTLIERQLRRLIRSSGSCRLRALLP